MSLFLKLFSTSSVKVLSRVSLSLGLSGLITACSTFDTPPPPARAWQPPAGKKTFSPKYTPGWTPTRHESRKDWDNSVVLRDEYDYKLVVLTPDYPYNPE